MPNVRMPEPVERRGVAALQRVHLVRGEDRERRGEGHRLDDARIRHQRKRRDQHQRIGRGDDDARWRSPPLKPRPRSTASTTRAAARATRARAGSWRASAARWRTAGQERHPLRQLLGRNPGLEQRRGARAQRPRPRSGERQRDRDRDRERGRVRARAPVSSSAGRIKAGTRSSDADGADRRNAAPAATPSTAPPPTGRRSASATP